MTGLLGILLRRVINIWLKYLTFSFLLILINEQCKNNILDVSSLLKCAINVTSNCFQEVIDIEARLKNHVDAFPLNVYGNNLHMTSSYFTFIKFKAIINCLTWSSSNTTLLGWNFSKSHSGCLCNGFKVPGMDITLIVSHGQFATMFLAKFQFSQEDGIKVTRVFI